MGISKKIKLETKSFVEINTISPIISPENKKGKMFLRKEKGMIFFVCCWTNINDDDKITRVIGKPKIPKNLVNIGVKIQVAIVQPTIK